MDMNTFKLIHSELMQWTQYIEHDLKVIYSILKSGDRDANLDDVDKKPLGALLKSFHNLDEEIGYSKIKPADYKLLDEVREIRNYWCHRGYVDFHYVEGDEAHHCAFQKVAEQLHLDEIKVYELHQKIERLRKSVEKKHKKK